MPWPTPQDYNEAVQGPALCFSLPELRGGRPELTPLGLPRAVTGGFASVYRISYGGSDWAVRCFLRQVADQQRRYEAISQHLSTVGLPYTAGFQYLEQGIKVQGRWYPVLKMDWVPGLPLNTYIQQNLSRPEKLKTLADDWLRMLQDLRRQGVAHGDLQHGNVLVNEGKLSLIDYDGMYVPALNNVGSNELGHRNYQHPLRDSQHFGPWLDNFSGWLVYLSLLAFSYEPALWQLSGDEHLLLRKDDLEQPGRTEVWKLLAGCKESIPALAAGLCDFLKLDPAKVPAPEPAEVERLAKRRQRMRIFKTRTNLREQAMTTHSAFAGPSWVLDHLTPEQPSGWQGGLLKERLLAGLWLLFNAAVASSAVQGTLVLTTAGYLAGGSSFLALVGLWCRYQMQPVVRHKRLLQQERQSLRWRLRLEGWRMHRLEARRARYKRAEEADRSLFKDRFENALEQERRALQSIDSELDEALLELEERRQNYRLNEVRELAQASLAYGREATLITRKYGGLYRLLDESATDQEARAAKRRSVASKRLRGQTDKALRWLKQRQEKFAVPTGKVQAALSRQFERLAMAEQDLCGCDQQLSRFRDISFGSYMGRLMGLGLHRQRFKGGP